MTQQQQHPITPPPELVQQWVECWKVGKYAEAMESDFFVAARAAQWGADQELEACVKWLNSYMPGNEGDRLLRTARRPKPPSLKEQALALINHDPANQPFLSDKGIDTIRRALEQLDD
jgi:hypothetical protein